MFKRMLRKSVVGGGGGAWKHLCASEHGQVTGSFKQEFHKREKSPD
jgi:hypothetical protein